MRQGSLTNIIACVANLDGQAGHVSTYEPTGFLAAVNDELRRCILVEHRQRGCAVDAEDCAMTTGLFMLLRSRGDLQVNVLPLIL